MNKHAEGWTVVALKGPIITANKANMTCCNKRIDLPL